MGTNKTPTRILPVRLRHRRSVIVEALVLSIVGALLGATVAWLLFNGHRFGTQGGSGFGSKLDARLWVRPALFGLGIAWACGIGIVGGLFPAIRAARLPVAAALRPT